MAKKKTKQQKYISEKLHISLDEVMGSSHGYDAFVVRFQKKYKDNIYQSPIELSYQGAIMVRNYIGTNVWYFNHAKKRPFIVDYVNIIFMNSNATVDDVPVIYLTTKDPDKFVKDPSIDHASRISKDIKNTPEPVNKIDFNKIHNITAYDQTSDDYERNLHYIVMTGSYDKGLRLDPRWVNFDTFMRDVIFIPGYQDFKKRPDRYYLTIRPDAYISGIRMIDRNTGIFILQVIDLCRIVK